MNNHIHLSTVSVVSVVCIVVLTSFFLHMAALRLSASENEGTQSWGKALAAGWA